MALSNLTTKTFLIFLTTYIVLVNVCALTSNVYMEERPHSVVFLDKIKEMDYFDKVTTFFDAMSYTNTTSDLHLLTQMTANILNHFHSGPLTSNTVDRKKVQAVLSFLKGIDKAKEIMESSRAAPSQCVHDIFRVVKSLLAGELWAVSFFDSFPKPGPSITKGWLSFVGNDEQCKESKPTDESGFTAKYCNLVIKLKISPAPVIVGFCSPSSCSSWKMTLFFQEMSSLFNTSAFSVDRVECITGKTNVTTATVFAILILSILGVLVIIGTFYDILIAQKKTIWASTNDMEKEETLSQSSTRVNNALPNEHQEVNVDPANDTDGTSSLITKSVQIHAHHRRVIRFLLAFSAYSNGKRILTTSTLQGTIATIHGIRFFSMSWVILGHTFVYGGVGSAFNIPTAFQTFLGRWTFDVVLNWYFSVDTFFTLSGLLTSYITIKQLWSRGLRINWGMFYFHRFWRLTPPYMFVLVIVLGLQQYLGQGPLWNNVQPADKRNCETNWWTNLLYINNFMPLKESCFVHAWYLAVDMQFFFISPIMIIPFYFSKRAGISTCTCVLLVSWIITGVLANHYGWGITVLSSLQNQRLDTYYTKPWCRIGPYVIGIVAGYILALKRGKPFKIRPWIVVGGWLISIASALAVIYGINGYFDGFGEHPDETNRDARALYNTVSRSVWAVCVSWVIIACTAGYGGPVTTILSWSPFVVLGRLTFMAYLFHIPVMNVFFGNFGSMYYLDTAIFTLLYVGLLVISYMVAFVGMLVLESPIIWLEKIFLKR